MTDQDQPANSESRPDKAARLIAEGLALMHGHPSVKVGSPGAPGKLFVGERELRDGLSELFRWLDPARGRE